jgi:hypothetical protein
MRLAGTAGAPARNEREVRKDGQPKDCAPDGAFAGGAPAVPAHHWTVGYLCGLG